MTKNSFEWEFSIVKLVAREVIIFPQKFKTHCTLPELILNRDFTLAGEYRNRHKMIQNTYHGSKHSV